MYVVPTMEFLWEYIGALQLTKQIAQNYYFSLSGGIKEATCGLGCLTMYTT